MNREDAKIILRVYRPESPDAEDPEIAEALALAGRDLELAHWLDQHCARQNAVRRQFRQIAPPAGLLEQIVSEHQAQANSIYRRRGALLLAAAAMVVILAGLPFWLRTHQPDGGSFSTCRTQMAATALRGYGMDLVTNDPAQIRSYLAENRAPADYVLPEPLQKAALAGCAIENWQGRKISMICFRTGRPLTGGQQSDMWLFVIDPTTVSGAPVASLPEFAKISRLNTAVWNQDGRLYLLGTTADAAVLRKFL